MSIPASLFGGKLVLQETYLTSSTTTITATEAAFRETPGTWNQQLVTTNGGSLRFSITAANSAGAYGDYTNLRHTRLGQFGNVEILARVLHTGAATVEQYGVVLARSDDVAIADVEDSNCIGFEWGPNSASLFAVTLTGGASTQWANPAKTFSGNSFWLRAAAVADRLYMKMWDGSATGNSEEPTWDVDGVAHTGPMGRGYVKIGLGGGNSGTVDFDVFFQELWVWDLDAPKLGAIAGAM